MGLLDVPPPKRPQIRPKASTLEFRPKEDRLCDDQQAGVKLVHRSVKECTHTVVRYHIKR